MGISVVVGVVVMISCILCRVIGRRRGSGISCVLLMAASLREKQQSAYAVACHGKWQDINHIHATMQHCILLSCTRSGIVTVVGAVALGDILKVDLLCGAIDGHVIARWGHSVMLVWRQERETTINLCSAALWQLS